LANFGVTWQPAVDSLLVTASGEVDIATAPELENALLQAEANLSGLTSLVLDISGVTFLGSVGINIMMRFHHRCATAGLSFTVSGPHGTVARVLRITAADTILHLVATPPEVSANPT
jgi:anti-sigma B factor antagonist